MWNSSEEDERQTLGGSINASNTIKLKFAVAHETRAQSRHVPRDLRD